MEPLTNNTNDTDIPAQKTKRGRGRPPLFNEEIVEQIRVFVAAGNYLETAAAYVGVHRDTLFKWLRKASEIRKRVEKEPEVELTKDEELYVHFFYAINKSYAEAEIRDLNVLATAAAAGVWQASAWRLERRNGRRWGRGQVFQTTDVSDELLSDEERRNQQGTTIIPVGLVLPVALPLEAHEALLDQLRAQGRLPGVSIDDAVDRVVRQVGSGGTGEGPVLDVEAMRGNE